MNYSVLSRLQWIHLDANILEMIPRKMGGGEKGCFGICEYGLKSKGLKEFLEVFSHTHTYTHTHTQS